MFRGSVTDLATALCVHKEEKRKKEWKCISCYDSSSFDLKGKPKPEVIWTKDGKTLDPKKVNVRSTEKDSILFIRKAERDDSGNYEMCVKVDSFEDKAIIILQIIGKQRVNITYLLWMGIMKDR